MTTIVDGSRRRRSSRNATKRRWYAIYREQRFRRRFGWPAEVGGRSLRTLCARGESQR
ncbi:MAG: hypothetical protein KY475_22865 [Planctomycetes bacterium]|nr:hypothetical protein [Planctomycetota bacterium]